MINREELLKFTQQAVQIESMSGEESVMADLLFEKMTELEYDDVWIDQYGSVIGKIKGLGNGQSILFDGHMDTVPINNPEKWTFDPLGGEVQDGKMYGRGTSDMKGAVCAAILAGGDMIKRHKRPQGDVYISCSVLEEVLEGVALGKIIEQVKPDNVVIMEPSNLNVSIGQLGRAEIKITAYGESAHSSTPQYAINAIDQMIPVLTALKDVQSPTHEKFGKGISVVTDIISAPYPGTSVIPNLCEIIIDRRLLINETKKSVLSQYEMMLPQVGQYNIRIGEAKLMCYTGAVLEDEKIFPGWLIDEDHPLVSTALATLKNKGQQPELTTYKFCTNGSYSAGIAHIPTIGYGPSNPSLLHIVDEYIELDQLYTFADSLVDLAFEITTE